MLKHKIINADVLYEEYEGHICISIVDREEKEWILCGTTGKEDCLKINTEYFGQKVKLKLAEASGDSCQ